MVSLRSRGTTVFVIVWFGQLISVVGSGLTSFALGVWVFQRTGSATQFALIGLSAVLPRVLISPLAGVVVDRWDRRRLMILSDAGAGFSTLILVFLLATNQLDTWHIYLIAAVNAAVSAVQWPAYAATTTLLVPKEHLGRANGMVQFGQAAAEILAPALAGIFIQTVRLEGVILIDFATFLFAVATLSIVRFPRPAANGRDEVGHASLGQDITLGWKYIAARPGLLGLLIFFAVVNLLWGVVGALITPMILGFTSSQTLGFLISVAGVGMLTGSLAMGLWGGPKRRINGVLGFEFLSGVCFVLMGLRPSFWPVALGAFGAHITIAIVFGCNQAIWQSKVAPDVQGRVFATQQMVAKAAAPLAYLLSGPLVDRYLEPLFATTGPMTESLGQVIGAGPGRGIGFLFVLMGIVKMGVVLFGYASPSIRYVEEELPDAIGEALGVPSI
jgi:DHA3 family macrolide efflux protein-like MFS transporter